MRKWLELACCYFYEHSDILKILFRYRTDDDFVLFLNERFNEQYPNLINKGYFTDVDDNTMRLGTFYYAGGIYYILRQWITEPIKESQPSSKQMKKKPVIVCGDFNVAATELDIKNPKANVKNAGFTPEEREKFKTLLDSGFTDTYRYLHPDQIEYSWWSYRFKARERNAGWRIDYFLTSDFAQDKIQNARIHTGIMGSDHCPVELDIDL